MIRTAVTVCLVEQAQGGPFVLWDGIESSCRTAAEIGFDAIELFAPSPAAVPAPVLRELLQTHRLELAAVGTGAGMVMHGLSLCDPDPRTRNRAKQFVREMISYGAQLEVPAIIGSMQGKWGGEVDRPLALDWLRLALNELGEEAGRRNQFLLYEPLNRYETNLCNTIAEGIELCRSLATSNVKLLADVFHMGIEEAEPAAAMAEGAEWIGHVHFVDSNRQAPGRGHLDLTAIAQALVDHGYDRFLSAECFPIPNSRDAARQTLTTYRRLFPSLQSRTDHQD